MSKDVIIRYAYREDIGVEAKSLEFLWDKAELTRRVHRTDFYQLLYVEEGELNLELDFCAISIKSKELILISPGQVCSFLLDTTTPIGFAVLFRPEVLGDLGADHELLRHASVANISIPKPLNLSDFPVSIFINQIIQELNQKEANYMTFAIGSYLRVLLIAMARLLPTSSHQYNPITRKFLDEVEGNYHHWHQVSDYLLRLQTSDKVLTRVLKNTLGLSPKAYIAQRILLEAKRMLAYSELSIKEIGFALGFDEPTNFNKFFRKYSGMTPLAFRLSSSRDVRED